MAAGSGCDLAGLVVAVAALILWPGALRLDLFPLFAQLYASRVQAMAVLLGLGTVVLVLARGAGDCGGWPSFCSP